jgi:hypothetical protein
VIATEALKRIIAASEQKSSVQVTVVVAAAGRLSGDAAGAGHGFRLSL